MGESVFLKEMGQRIMTRRKSLRFTQEELAEITGHSMQTMFKYYHDLDEELLQSIANASESRD